MPTEQSLPNGDPIGLANIAAQIQALVLPDGTNDGDRLEWRGGAWTVFNSFIAKAVVPGGQNINPNGTAAGNDLDFSTATLTSVMGPAPSAVAGGLVVPFDGDYKVRGSYHCTSPNNVRYSGIFRATVDGVLIQEGQGAEGYIRDSSNDQETGGDFSITLTGLTSGQVVGANVQRESGGGQAVSLVAGSYLELQRVD